MKSLKIASTLSLPAEAVSQTFGILGIRGSGKTNTSVVMVEEMLSLGLQVVVLDPLDVWHGLRTSKDGKSAGFAITVIGGEHADLPLEPGSGSLIADFVVEHQMSVILSVRHLSMNEQRKFATDFAEQLFHRKGKDEFKTPMHLVVDEADEFVPQRIPPGGERMFGAFDRIVRRGRSCGIGVTLISQRAQVMNKDVLSQIETLIAMRVLQKHDRKAMEAWVIAHDTEGKQDEFMGSLATLERGDAWVWSPAWLNIFKRVHIRERTTFDSSATPKAGEVQIVVEKRAPVDLEALRVKLSATVEQAKANDPTELKKQIAERDKKIRQLESTKPGILSDKREVTSVLAAIGKRDKQFTQAKDAILRHRNEAVALIQKGLTMLGEIPNDVEVFNTLIPFKHVTDFNENVHKINESVHKPNDNVHKVPKSVYGSGQVKLPPGELAVLKACAQYNNGMRRDQLTILTGYKRSSRDAYIQRLKEKQFIRQSGDLLHATDEGIAALGDNFEPLPTGIDLQNYWLNKLPPGEKAMLQILIREYPRSVSRDALSEESGYQRSSRDAYLQRMSAKELIQNVGRGEVKAADSLFE